MNQQSARLAPTVMPPVEVTGGVYHSQVSLGSENFILPDTASKTRESVALPKPETVVAIGMAAIPAGSKGEQLNRLTYKGMTSEQYAAGHQNWMNNFAAQEQILRDIERAAASSDEDEEDDEDEDAKAKKPKVGVGLFVGTKH